jgi:hypothetical protein
MGISIYKGRTRTRSHTNRFILVKRHHTFRDDISRFRILGIPIIRKSEYSRGHKAYKVTNTHSFQGACFTMVGLSSRNSACDNCITAIISAHKQRRCVKLTLAPIRISKRIGVLTVGMQYRIGIVAIRCKKRTQRFGCD